MTLTLIGNERTMLGADGLNHKKNCGLDGEIVLGKAGIGIVALVFSVWKC